MTFADLVETATGGEPPRVWSLLVTVFGDLAQGTDDWLSGTFLRDLTTQIGIKPEAVRVALHRLRKDGWIENRRDGRRMDYRLTAFGRAQSAQASPRIYAEAAGSDCYVILRNTPDTDSPTHWVNETTGLSPIPLRDGFALSLQVAPQALPDWMRIAVADEALMTAARATSAMLTGLEKQIPQADGFTPLQIAVLRVLIVHAWRRVILKSPALPDAAFPDGWEGPACRKYTQALLARLPHPDLAELT